jgi:hypothetical protein
MPKKFSASAILLIFLLAIRTLGQFIIFAIPGFSEIARVGFYFALSTTIGLIYFLALLGVLFKTRWGAILVLILAIIDIIAVLFSTLGLFGNIIAIIVDLFIFGFSINILKRN